MDIVTEIERNLLDKDVRTRRRALTKVADKKAGAIELKVRDRRVVPILARALADQDMSVRRSAAIALRPFLQEDPALMATVLPAYAIDTFDGKYTHVGLLDAETGKIWIPPFQAKGGHAALMADGSTDRYFKFDFYVPGQAPPQYKRLPGGEKAGHLTQYFIGDWSYSKRALLTEFDERQLWANRREQENLARRVVAFYRHCRLPYRVYVHRLSTQGSQKPLRELQVAVVETGDNS